MSKYSIGKCIICERKNIVGTIIEDKLVCDNCAKQFETDIIGSLKSCVKSKDQQLAELKAENEKLKEENKNWLFGRNIVIEELKQQLKEKDEEIAKLQRLVKAWSEECERKFALLQDNTKFVCGRIRKKLQELYKNPFEEFSSFLSVKEFESKMLDILDQIKKGG